MRMTVTINKSRDRFVDRIYNFTPLLIIEIEKIV